MRARSAAALAATVLVLAGCSPQAPSAPRETSIEVDTPALREQKADVGVEDCEPGTGDNGLPALTLPCLGGGPDVDLSTLQGPVLINMWASFCGPCREEMPALQAFDQQYGDQVPVLGIDLADPAPVAALALMRETGATYPSLADPTGALLSQPDLPLGNGLPKFVLLDEEGQIVKRSLGGLSEPDEVVDYVEAGLGTTL